MKNGNKAADYVLGLPLTFIEADCEEFDATYSLDEAIEMASMQYGITADEIDEIREVVRANFPWGTNELDTYDKIRLAFILTSLTTEARKTGQIQ